MATRKLEEKKASAPRISRTGINNMKELVTGGYSDSTQGQTQENSRAFATGNRNTLHRNNYNVSSTVSLTYHKHHSEWSCSHVQMKILRQRGA